MLDEEEFIEKVAKKTAEKAEEEGVSPSIRLHIAEFDGGECLGQ